MYHYMYLLISNRAVISQDKINPEIPYNKGPKFVFHSFIFLICRYRFRKGADTWQVSIFFNLLPGRFAINQTVTSLLPLPKRTGDGGNPERLTASISNPLPPRGGTYQVHTQTKLDIHRLEPKNMRVKGVSRDPQYSSLPLNNKNFNSNIT